MICATEGQSVSPREYLKPKSYGIGTEVLNC